MNSIKERMKAKEKMIAMKLKAKMCWGKLRAAIKTKAIDRMIQNKYNDMIQEALFLVSTNQVITEVEDPAKIPIWKQGNLEFYTPENIRRRRNLQFDPGVSAVLNLFWRVGDFHRESMQKITEEEYKNFMMRVYKVVLYDFTPLQAKEAIDIDWEKDSKGLGYMTEKMLRDALFELADTWCLDIDGREYEEFLFKIFKNVTVGSPPMFKPLEDIKFDGSVLDGSKGHHEYVDEEEEKRKKKAEEEERERKEREKKMAIPVAVHKKSLVKNDDDNVKKVKIPKVRRSTVKDEKKNEDDNNKNKKDENIKIEEEVKEDDNNNENENDNKNNEDNNKDNNEIKTMFVPLKLAAPKIDQSSKKFKNVKIGNLNNDNNYNNSSNNNNSNSNDKNCNNKMNNGIYSGGGGGGNIGEDLLNLLNGNNNNNGNGNSNGDGNNGNGANGENDENGGDGSNGEGKEGEDGDENNGEGDGENGDNNGENGVDGMNGNNNNGNNAGGAAANSKKFKNIIGKRGKSKSGKSIIRSGSPNHKKSMTGSGKRTSASNSPNRKSVSPNGRKSSPGGRKKSIKNGGGSGNNYKNFLDRIGEEGENSSSGNSSGNNGLSGNNYKLGEDGNYYDSNGNKVDKNSILNNNGINGGGSNGGNNRNGNKNGNNNGNSNNNGNNSTLPPNVNYNDKEYNEDWKPSGVFDKHHDKYDTEHLPLNKDAINNKDGGVDGEAWKSVSGSLTDKKIEYIPPQNGSGSDANDKDHTSTRLNTSLDGSNKQSSSITAGSGNGNNGNNRKSKRVSKRISNTVSRLSQVNKHDKPYNDYGSYDDITVREEWVPSGIIRKHNDIYITDPTKKDQTVGDQYSGIKEYNGNWRPAGAGGAGLDESQDVYITNEPFIDQNGVFHDPNGSVSSSRRTSMWIPAGLVEQKYIPNSTNGEKYVNPTDNSFKRDSKCDIVVTKYADYSAGYEPSGLNTAPYADPKNNPLTRKLVSDGPSVPKFGKGPDNYIPSIFSSEPPPDPADKRKSRISNQDFNNKRLSSISGNGRRSSLANKRVSQISPNSLKKTASTGNLNPQQQQQSPPEDQQQNQQQTLQPQQSNKHPTLSRQGSNFSQKSNRSPPLSKQGSGYLLNRQNSNKSFQYSEALQKKIEMLKEHLKTPLSSPSNANTVNGEAIPDYYAMENQKMKELEYEHQMQYIEQLKRQEEIEYQRQWKHLQLQKNKKMGSNRSLNGNANPNENDNTQNILVIPEEKEEEVVEGEKQQQQQEGEENKEEEEEEERPKTPEPTSEIAAASQRWNRAQKTPIQFAKTIDVSAESNVQPPVTIPADKPTMEFTFVSEVAEKRKSELRKKIYVGSKHNVRLLAPPGMISYRSASPTSTTNTSRSRSSMFSTTSSDDGSSVISNDLPEHNLTRTSIRTLYNRPASAEITENDMNTYTVDIIPSSPQNRSIPNNNNNNNKQQRERSNSPQNPSTQQLQQQSNLLHGPSPLRPKTADSQISQFTDSISDRNSRVAITREYENVSLQTTLPDNIIPISADKVYYDSKGANNKNLSLGKSQIPVLASLISGNQNAQPKTIVTKPKPGNKVENLSKQYEDEISGDAYRKKSKLFNRISSVEESKLPSFLSDDGKVNEVNSKTLDVIQKRNNKDNEENNNEEIKVNTDSTTQLDPLNATNNSAAAKAPFSPIKDLKNIKSKLMEPTVSSLAATHPKIVKEEKKFEMKPIRPLSPLLPNTFLVLDGVLTSKLPPKEINMCVVPPKNSKQMQQIEQYSKLQNQKQQYNNHYHNNNDDEFDDEFDDNDEIEYSGNNYYNNSCNFDKTKTTIASSPLSSSPHSNNNNNNNTVEEEKSEGSLMSVRPCTTVPQSRKSELVVPIRKTVSSQGKRPTKQQQKHNNNNSEKIIDYYKYTLNNNSSNRGDDIFELPPLKTSQYELSKSINTFLPTFSQRPSELSFKLVGEFEYPIQKFSRSAPLYVDDVF